MIIGGSYDICIVIVLTVFSSLLPWDELTLILLTDTSKKGFVQINFINRIELMPLFSVNEPICIKYEYSCLSFYWKMGNTWYKTPLFRSNSIYCPWCWINDGLINPFQMKNKLLCCLNILRKKCLCIFYFPNLIELNHLSFSANVFSSKWSWNRQ